MATEDIRSFLDIENPITEEMNRRKIPFNGSMGMILDKETKAAICSLLDVENSIPPSLKESSYRMARELIDCFAREGLEIEGCVELLLRLNLDLEERIERIEYFLGDKLFEDEE